MTDPRRISVIIPFYQREPGLLRRAVQSIFEQKLEPDLHVQIIVIDDGSPVHAAADLDGAPPPCPAIEMICVRQANGGCAAARNAGLALAASDSGAIAFLDSDDIWAPNHLATAVAAISEGFDFYFSDHSRDDFYPSYFEEIGFPGSMPTTGLSLSGHQICEVAQRDFFEFFLKRYVPQISTVVYRRSIAPGGIFSSALKFASEDYLFLLSLVQAATRVCYGLEDKARCGAGINVYYSTFSWDDEGHIRRHMGDLLGTYAIRSDLQLTAEGEALIDKRIVDLRRLNAFFLLRWALKGRLSWSEDLRQLVQADPDFWKWLPATLPFVIRQQLLRQGPGSVGGSSP